ncbi:hypothetical protein [Streptosporangium carneum]|nr:hypothetical protein [Streptosporangium carneum]
MLGSALIAPIVVALPASAATGSWTVYQPQGTITSDGGSAITYFSKATTPSTGQITGTTLLVQPYSNGRTSETVDVCYQEPGTATDYRCAGPFSFSSSMGIWLHSFDGLDPKGTITVKHTLHGGTYPAAGTGVDRVTVDYQY